MILSQTYKLLNTRYRDQVKDLFIKDVRVGVHMTAVLLSDGSAGVAATVVDAKKACKKEDRFYGTFSPGNIIGGRLSELFEADVAGKVTGTLRIAALNAISSTIVAAGSYHILENTDPIDLIDLGGNKTITVVGAFHSYIQTIGATQNRLQVLELNKAALEPDHQKYYIPASDFQSALAKSEVVIITGFTLVNDTLDSLLEAIPEGIQVIVVGPSGNLLPDVLFENKVNIIGATQITDARRLLEIVGQGGSGFHLFKYCAKKICIVNKEAAKGIRTI